MKINKQFTYLTLVNVRCSNFALNSNPKLCVRTLRTQGDYTSHLVKKVTNIQKKSYICKKKDYLTQGLKGSVKRIVTRNTNILFGWKGISKSYTYNKSFYFNTSGNYSFNYFPSLNLPCLLRNPIRKARGGIPFGGVASVRPASQLLKISGESRRPYTTPSVSSLIVLSNRAKNGPVFKSVESKNIQCTHLRPVLRSVNQIRLISTGPFDKGGLPFNKKPLGGADVEHRKGNLHKPEAKKHLKKNSINLDKSGLNKSKIINTRPAGAPHVEPARPQPAGAAIKNKKFRGAAPHTRIESAVLNTGSQQPTTPEIRSPNRYLPSAPTKKFNSTRLDISSHKNNFKNMPAYNKSTRPRGPRVERLMERNLFESDEE